MIIVRWFYKKYTKMKDLINKYIPLNTCLVISLWTMSITPAACQSKTIVNMAPIDGATITPANIFGYYIQSAITGNMTIKGTIVYRNSNMRLSYIFNLMLVDGLNKIDKELISPQWQFSTSSLRELFFNYNTLPSGTFEYCVSISPVNSSVETNKDGSEECLYHRANDMFLINLVDPEDKATLKEYNPMLVWIANYSFSNELTYRIRVAEMKQGQNSVNAVMRNQPVYEESNLMRNSIVYPIYAKPLISSQPYAWTVDAYYKDILLGGSETWQFIIADSLLVNGKSNRSYIDIKRESGHVQLTAIGDLKLKYLLDDASKDNLSLELLNDKGKKCSFTQNNLTAVYGDNRYVLDFTKDATLKHKGVYTLKINTLTKHEYKLRFQFINPLFVR